MKIKTADIDVHTTNEICMAFTGQSVISSVSGCTVTPQDARYQSATIYRLYYGSITPATVHMEKA
jgi:hypothetical protein